MFNFITKYVGGISFNIQNPENIINGRVIYAIRHESMWETLALMCLFERPVFVLKKELGNIPIFGYLAKRVQSIFVDRSHEVRSLIEVSRKISQALDNGSQVVIFPEGTRLKPGEYIPLKRGISLFYKKNNCYVVPVIHDSGKFWPKHSFIKKQGIITVKFIEAIRPGLSQDEFMDKLNDIFCTELKQLEM